MCRYGDRGGYSTIAPFRDLGHAQAGSSLILHLEEPVMARKKATPAEPPPAPRHRIRFGKDAKGTIRVIDYESGEGVRSMSVARLEECAIVDVGRPFTFYVPSVG